MCVIYKNGIIRIRRNYLNSAGHALALFERRKDIGKIKSREYGANCGAHRVINGKVTGYAYVCSAYFIVPKEFVLHRGGGANNIFCHKLRLIVFSRKCHDLYRESVYHIMCRLVIDVYNSRVRYFKQLALGVSIVFKGFVIVKVILREIGKQCYVEMTSVYPSLRECLGRDLHNAVFTAAVNHFPEESLKLFAVGSGKRRRVLFVARYVFNRAYKSGFYSEIIENSF